MIVETVIKKGPVVVATSGEYSDYMILGVFMAESDIDIVAAKAEWLKLHPEQRSEFHFNEEGFLSFLCNKRMSDISWRGLHLGEYGNIENIEVIVPEGPPERDTDD